MCLPFASAFTGFNSSSPTPKDDPKLVSAFTAALIDAVAVTSPEEGDKARRRVIETFLDLEKLKIDERVADALKPDGGLGDLSRASSHEVIAIV
ncbi:hypothetical protein HDU93_003883 [Gonapodya sp. JEL0774]|nr:hypothetical protein HDU93_003883 [Gonapodya sp. JEL0774]